MTRISRYEDVVEVCKDPVTFSTAQGATLPVIGNVVPAVPLESDPPEHTRYRRFLGPRFRKVATDSMEPTIRRIVRGSLDKIQGTGECDLVPALCDQVPVIVIADLLGLPEEDWDVFRTWTANLQRSAYVGDTESNVRAAKAIGGYLAERGNPQLIARFVTESLRYEAPVTGMARTATCPADVGGNHIAEGDKLLLLFTSANHDERVYNDPETFELERGERSHLAFGYGAHRCLGEQLAILELNVIVDEVLTELPDYALKPGTVVAHTPWTARGPVSLPVVFTPEP